MWSDVKLQQKTTSLREGWKILISDRHTANRAPKFHTRSLQKARIHQLLHFPKPRSAASSSVLCRQYVFKRAADVQKSSKVKTQKVQVGTTLAWMNENLRRRKAKLGLQTSGDRAARSSRAACQRQKLLKVLKMINGVRRRAGGA